MPMKQQQQAMGDITTGTSEVETLDDQKAPFSGAGLFLEQESSKPRLSLKERSRISPSLGFTIWG
ncbi:hypothetical protein CCACVL1_00034 [Corchorus capsularis]|uniref:Uncharacterized protein n=1 Tax=Corchorus capsularis TaxID=210143 RepID=A0A1R3KZ12_COCAP|nr:hypothetical protein CCACVL1_00034 [Corchorus capsularis]